MLELFCFLAAIAAAYYLGTLRVPAGYVKGTGRVKITPLRGGAMLTLRATNALREYFSAHPNVHLTDDEQFDLRQAITDELYIVARESGVTRVGSVPTRRRAEVAGRFEINPA